MPRWEGEVSESTLEYRVYYFNHFGATGKVCEEEFASLTEAEIRKAQLKREGITARIVGIRTTIDDRS